MNRSNADGKLPTLTDLTRAYPRLRELIAEARSIRDDGGSPCFCGNACRTNRRSGGGASLRCRTVAIADKAAKKYGTWQAYDLVYSAVYDCLPDCRGACGCFNPAAVRIREAVA